MNHLFTYHHVSIYHIFTGFIYPSSVPLQDKRGMCINCLLICIPAVKMKQQLGVRKSVFLLLSILITVSERTELMTQVDLLLQPTDAEAHIVQEAAREVKNQTWPSGDTKPGLQRGCDQRVQNYPFNQSTGFPESIQITCHALSHPFGWCSWCSVQIGIEEN